MPEQIELGRNFCAAHDRRERPLGRFKCLTERIELGSKCRVEGSISANTVVMWDGARFDGGIDMRQRTISAKMAQYRADTGPAVPSSR